ncbi:DUF4407 domain-containing protein [Actinomadura harenae]|uniref:DUF4407 domain-containing protein n=1 Tax=Actinomadura harenae TaxID=2483351 RepID=A0A3M2LNU5_9ACTN|nr:DUF4407 domain-containing protein [Actinomadura harenae]RMI38213.1 DUF4407 domain-containing protein [Actinomadura harenae]
MSAPGGYDGDQGKRRSLLIWYAGADTRLLKSPTDRLRYTCLGGAVLFTAAIAGVSMFDAVHMALRVPILVQLGVAVVWFVGISNLDRWFVTSMSLRHVQPGPWDDVASEGGKLRMALPRVAMALLLGFLVSTPLTLQIFDSEIQQEIQQIHQNQLDSHHKQVDTGSTGRRIASLTARRDALNKVIESNGLTPDVENDPDVKALETRLAALGTQYADLSQKATCEDTGTTVDLSTCKGTTGKQGRGKWFDYYTGQADSVKAQMNTVNGQLSARRRQIVKGAKGNSATAVARARRELPTVLAELKTAQTAQDTLTAGYDRSVLRSTGLLIRIQALVRISKGSPITFVVELLLWAVLMLIDCLPMIVKLSSTPGPYENLLARQQELDENLGRRAQQAEQRADRVYIDVKADERERSAPMRARADAAAEHRLRENHRHRPRERAGRHTRHNRRPRPDGVNGADPHRPTGPKGLGPHGPRRAPKERAGVHDWPSVESTHQAYTEGGFAYTLFSRVFWLKRRYERPGR